MQALHLRWTRRWNWQGFLKAGQMMGLMVLASFLLACGGGSSAAAPAPTPTPAPVATPTPLSTPTPDPIASLPVLVDGKSDDTSGVFFGIFRESGSSALADTVASDLRFQPASILWFMSWGSQADFPASDVKAMAQKGILAHIAWEPWDTAKAFDAADQIHLQDILDGKWDAYVSKWAKAAKDADVPVLLRWGHEMNGNWYPWAPALNGQDASLYVKAYQHVHDLFVAQGATKVQWIWCINNDSVPNETWNAPAALYPGDAYVDWMGLDGYNWGTGVSYGSWRSFSNLFSSAYDKVQAIAPAKPIIIAEFASAVTGGDKAAWIQDLFQTLPVTFPKVKAFTWFDVQKEQDWRIHSSDAAFQAFALGLRKDWVRGNGTAMTKVVLPTAPRRVQ